MSHKVICIGRQFGSGGFLIGKALSEKLDAPNPTEDSHETL